MSASPSPASQNHFRRLAHQKLREGAAVATSLGILRVKVSDVSPPYVTTTAGDKLINFASCCYLETTTRPAIVAASLEATASFGTQLSLSPAYMALNLYQTFTDRLEEVTARPVALAATTTLSHFGTLPAIVDPADLVVVDRQAHNSLQMATSLLAGYNSEVVTIPHNDLGALEAHLRDNPDRRVWYVCDGLYSMFGDTAPYPELRALADSYDNLWLYIDDAHGAGWSGVHGRGEATDVFVDHPRTVTVLGLSKSWGAGGAAVTFPSDDMREAAVSYPGTFIFSGPLKPSELGAGIASADYHLSPAWEADSAHLRDLIDHTIAESDRLGLDLVDRSQTPIFFIRIGPTDLAITVAAQLIADGRYVNVSAFPVVPRNQAGIRFTITSALTREQISELLVAVRDTTEALSSAA